MSTVTWAVRVSFAIFYPSLFGFMQVDLHNTKIPTTTDSGTACSELRHYIDATTLLELEGGSLASVVPPEPPVVKILDRGGGGQNILGMLSEPLHAYVAASGGRHILEDVLVVENFSVPLHISIKRLKVCRC